MSSTQIHRHDRGAKVAGRKMGGKFAAHRRAAATFPGSEIPDGGTLTLQEDFKAITERAHQILRARGISDPDQRNDMVQDVAMDLWQQALKGKADLSTEHRGMVSTVASRKAAQFFNNGERHEDHRARTMLDEKANAQEQALGRKLTRSERQELVDEITRSFPAGGRPIKGWENGKRVTEQLQENEADFDEVGVSHQSELAVTDEYPSDSEEVDARLDRHAYARALERMDGVGVREMKLQAWEIFREHDPRIPAVQPLDRAAASAVRQHFEGVEGGAVQVASDWLDGRVSVEAERALFRPFGGVDALTAEQQIAVAERIGNDPTRGDQMWEAAVARSRALEMGSA